MRLITVDSLLLAEVNTLAETRTLELLRELNEARARMETEPTPETRRVYAVALGTHQEALRAVGAIDKLLYGKPANVVPFVHPAAEPAVEGLVSVVDPVCPCGELLPAYIVPAVNHKQQQICFACEKKQVEYREAAREGASSLVGREERL